MISEKTICLIQQERALWLELDKATSNRVTAEYLTARGRAEEGELGDSEKAEEDVRKAWHQMKRDAQEALRADLQPLGLSLEDIAGVAR